MATTLTPRGKIFYANGMVEDYGDYATDGSTTATLSVSGGEIVSVIFSDANENILTTATSNTVTLSAKSLSGSVTSYTLTPGGGAVTGGNYRVLHGGV